MEGITLNELLSKPLSNTIRQQVEKLKGYPAVRGALVKEWPAENQVAAAPSRQTIICPIAPMGKPRMTRRDKWAKRPCVMRYREFADFLRVCFMGVDLSKVHDLSWVAYFPIPKSWSKKRKRNLQGQSHWNTPDRDNIDKAILDALFDQDSGISHGTLAKLWDDGKGPRIEITIN